MIKMKGIIKTSPLMHISWHRYLQLPNSILFSLLQDDLYVFMFSRKERTFALRQDHQTNSGLQLLKREDEISSFNAHLSTKQFSMESNTKTHVLYLVLNKQLHQSTQRASLTHLAEVWKWCMVGSGKVQRKLFMVREMRWVKTQFHLQSLLL